jgi:lipopolysaccharide/colanic/teichoic acid biosynthesis glycosyltransferase
LTKRALDITCATLGLVVTSPLVLVAALLVKLGSQGSVFYRGVRVGRDGREFSIYKIRSMSAGADRQGPAVTAAKDQRVTKIGRLLRRTKVDEIPQLFNVLRGDMSLVGPRPEHPGYVKLYTPEQREVLSVRPGLTGPAAVAFLDEERMLEGADPESTYVSVIMPQKLALDLAYVRTHTFRGDLAIIGKTALLVLRRAFPL